MRKGGGERSLRGKRVGERGGLSFPEKKKKNTYPLFKRRERKKKNLEGKGKGKKLVE